MSHIVASVKSTPELSELHGYETCWTFSVVHILFTERQTIKNKKGYLLIEVVTSKVFHISVWMVSEKICFATAIHQFGNKQLSSETFSSFSCRYLSIQLFCIDFEVCMIKRWEGWRLKFPAPGWFHGPCLQGKRK